jgi:hypothetical protein
MSTSFFCHDWYMLMLKSHKFNGIMFALRVLTFFLIFPHTLSLSKYHVKCEMYELYSYANLLLDTHVSNMFSNILTHIAINVVLRDVLSRLIFFISFVHIFNNDQFSILIWHAKSLWINISLNSFFLSCDKCFCVLITCWSLFFMCKSCYMLNENLFLMIIE